MTENSFWESVPKPIIGLSPMDGVTDACFRRIVAKHGKPDLILTEFTNIDGICHGAESELSGLQYHESERPVVAQIYGKEPELYFEVAQLVADLGFDGLDINMGCPAKTVAARGCGAGLIRDPGRAQAIISACREGIREWAAGAPLGIFKRSAKIEKWFRAQGKPTIPLAERRLIPVSVKTRLGTDRNMVKEWMPTLLAMRPAAISIHGRTLTQGYRGFADWGAIAEAKRMAEGTGTLIMGNGDVSSLEDARQRIETAGVDGVLIGRAALGNPWLFLNKEALRRNEPVPEPFVSRDQRHHVALEHARLFEEIRGLSRFVAMRKHLDWYCRGFPGAAAVRARLMQVNNPSEVEAILQPLMAEPALA